MATKKTILTLLLLLLFLPSSRALAQSGNEYISGTDRYMTSIEISKFGWQNGSDVAIIATGNDFPDALSASPLAKKYNAPILLTRSDTPDSKLIEELVRLNAKKVYIIGGNSVISKNIDSVLNGKGINCIRLFGNDRYETSAVVSAEIGTSNTAIIATGNDFPDALSIASFAASYGMPILLTDSDVLPSSVDKCMKAMGITSTYVVGGLAAVSDIVMSKLPLPKRISGNDRFETNVEVMKTFSSQFNLSKVYIATGNDFPDALSGSALASLTKSPIILTGTGLLAKTKSYITTNISQISEVHIVGGANVVSDNALAGVLSPLVSSIDMSMPDTNLGLSQQLKASVTINMVPKSSVAPSITYSISNTSIANVDSNGNVIGIKPGIVKLTASAGGKSASVDINVKDGGINVKDGKTVVIDPGHGGTSTGAVPHDLNNKALNEYRESVLNLQIAKKIESRLKSTGINVILTRNDDSNVDLDDRANIANKSNSDLFISIHHDSSANTSAMGSTAFYSSYKPGLDTSGVYTVSGGSNRVYGIDGSVLGNLEEDKSYDYVRDDGSYIYIMFNGKVGKVTLNDVLVYDNTPSVASQESGELASAINEGISNLGLLKRGAKDDNLAVNRMVNGVSVLVEVGFLSNFTEFQKISSSSFEDKVADAIVKAISDFYNKHESIPQAHISSPATP